MNASDERHAESAADRPRRAAATSDDELRQIFASADRVAVVGMKDDQSADAFRVPSYLQQHGYEIVPVNPKLSRVLECDAVASLDEVSAEIDLVNLFRAADHVPAHVDEILTMSPLPRTVWMQLGIVCSDSARRLRDAGIRVIQDRCIMVEHRRLHPR